MFLLNPRTYQLVQNYSKQNIHYIAFYYFSAFESIDTLTLHCGKENATYSCNDNFTIISENITEFVLQDRINKVAESG